MTFVHALTVLAEITSSIAAQSRLPAAPLTFSLALGIGHRCVAPNGSQKIQPPTKRF